MNDKTWVEACSVGDIEAEGALRFDHGGQTFAIYRDSEDAYFATDGYCTHERTPLADGLVIGEIIECPMHFGRFNFKTGEAMGAPVCIDLKTYPVRIEAGKVFINIQ